MARGIRLPIIGDPESLLKAFKQSSEAADSFGRHVKQLGTTAEESAKLQVEASLKKDRRLRAEIATYKQIASAAKRGSQEQITAARLASQAEGRLARSLSVTAKESRALSVSASHVERDFGRATRGALAGSGAFHSLGRSLAFASGGFLAFASVSRLLRDSVDAARDAAVTQRQLSTQLKTVGIRFREVRPQIEQADERLSHLSGFTADRLEKTFTTLVRSTGNVGRALRLNSVAADIARGSHKSLETVTLAVAKALHGQTGALSRLIGGLPKGISGIDAIRLAAEKFAGQAKAGATASDRFGAELHNTEVIVGTGLLPTINKYLAKGSDWLAQMNRSGKLQKDLAKAAEIVHGAIDGVRAVVGPLVAAFKALGTITGGTKNEVKLLAGAFALFKFGSFLSKFGLLDAGIAGIGTTAKDSAGKVGLLRRNLLLLGRVGSIAVAIDIFEHIDKKASGPRTKGDFLKNIPLLGAIDAAARDFANMLVPPPDRTPKRTGLPPGVQGPLRAGAPGRLGLGLPFSVSGAAILKQRLTPAQQRAIGLAENPDNLAALKAQRDADNRAIRFLKRRFAEGKVLRSKYVEQLVALENDRNQQQSHIDSLVDQANQKKAAAARKAAADAKKRAKAIADAAEADRAAIIKVAFAGVKLGVDAGKLSREFAAAQAKAARAAAAAAQKLKEAITQARDQIGALFAGPVLAPTDFQTKARLGVPGPNPRTLVADIRAQVQQDKMFQANLARLSQAGAPAGLISELRGRGLEVAPQVAALAGAGRGLQRQFFKAFGSREAFATRVGTMAVRAQAVHIQAAAGVTATGVNERNPRPIIINLDGRKIAEVVTTHQQRRTNPLTQRRGRNPGIGHQPLS